MIIFGLAGCKQVGKSSMTKFIRQILAGYKVEEMALAEPLKDFCIDFFDVPRESVYGSDEQKNTPLQSWDWSLVNQTLRTKYNKNIADPLSGRELLQIVGTDVFRQNFNQDIWVELLFRRVRNSNANVIVVSDVRFENEFYAVKQNGGRIIRLYRDMEITESIKHSSETGLDQIPDSLCDHVITAEQNLNLNTLFEATVNILKKERLI